MSNNNYKHDLVCVFEPEAQWPINWQHWSKYKTQALSAAL